MTEVETKTAAGVICVRRSDKKLLLIKHTDGDHWGVPKGHKDDTDASDIACALRETAEETGITELTLIPDFKHELHYVRPASKKYPSYPKRVVYFLGWLEDSTTVELSHEHTDYQFISSDQIDENIQFENLREALKAAMAHIA